MWSLGGTAAGSKREQVVTSISSGDRDEAKVSGVPQRGQKVRTPCAEERRLAGSPDTKRNPDLGTLNHATKGAPLMRRQIEQ